MWWKPTDQQLGLNSLPAGQRDLDPRDGLLVGHGPCVLHHLGPVLDLHVIWQTRTKKKPKKAVLLKIKWQLVWLSQQSDQSWSCVYFVTLNECFFTSFIFKTCLQPKHWKIYKPPHKTPLVFLLGTWWFNIWKSFALTNSVYLQRHHTTLIAWCQLITFGIKSVALPKNISSWMSQTWKDPELRWLTPTWSGTHAELVTLKPAGAEHTSHVMHWAQHQHDKMRGERRTNGRHMRQKRAVTTHPLFGAKCWNLFINMPL